MAKDTSELQASILSCISPASCASVFQPVSVEFKLGRATQLHRPITHPIGVLEGVQSFHSYLQPEYAAFPFCYKSTQKSNCIFSPPVWYDSLRPTFSNWRLKI